MNIQRAVASDPSKLPSILGTGTPNEWSVSGLLLRVALVAVIALVSTIAPPRAGAQTGAATVSGTVMDPQGRVVPGVEVNVTNVDTNASFSAKTNGDGIYVAPNLPPGRYRVSVTKQGFKSIALTDIELHTQDSVSRNFNLELGAASETVTIDANAMATDSAAVGIVIDHTFVESTPLNGRSFQDLIALAPGAITDQSTGQLSVNGQRSYANYFTVDGVSANTNPDYFGSADQPAALAGKLPAQTVLGTTQSLLSIDALDEFRVQTSTVDAESGREPGGQIQITSRSGTNQFHGSLYDYFRNEALDAENWFAHRAGSPKPPERQNDFGGTLGGPLGIPGLYNGRDRTFFFFSYEGLRLRTPSFSQEDVPTLTFRQQAAQGIQPFLNAFPLPNGKDNGDGTGVFAAGYGEPSTIDSTSVRVDHTIGQRFQLFARYSDTPSSSTNQFGSWVQTTFVNTNTLTFGATAKVSQNLIDEVRFNISWGQGGSSKTMVPIGGAEPFLKGLVVPPQYDHTNTYVGTVQLNLYGSGVPCCGVDNGYAFITSNQKQFNLVDNLTWIKANHSFKVGIDYRQLLPVLDSGDYQSFYGIESLTSVQQGLADFINLTSTPIPHLKYDNLSLFYQDHWKTSSRLTFDYGVRWEYDPAPVDTKGLQPLALFSANNLSNLSFQPSGSRIYRARYDNFAPRIGFAYQVRQSSRLPVVLRSGAGVYYDTAQSQAANPFLTYPNGSSSTLNSVPLPVAPGVVAPPPLLVPLTPPYQSLYLTDPNLRLPYTEEWNLSVDTNLNTENTLTVSYVGNAGRRILSSRSYDLSQDNPNFTFLYLTNNASFSSYNALQVQDHGRLFTGMQLIGSYSWAHGIDNSSSDQGAFSSYPGLLKGNSDNDLRQTFNLAIDYRFPSRSKRSWLGAIVNGWSTDVRIIAQTGYPFEVVQGFFNDPANGEQSIPIRPDRVPGVPLYLHGDDLPGGWAVNPTAFTPVPVDNNGNPLREGTLGRNYLHGPNLWQINGAVARDFALGDRIHLDFRVEAFNVLNHPNFGGNGNIDNILGDPTFGQFTSSFNFGPGLNALYQIGGTRSLQAVLRLRF